jgi:hypothetical protein
MLRKEITIGGLSENGHFQPDNVAEIEQWLHENKGRIECVLRRESEDISKRQRGFYYGKLLPAAARATGHSIEEIDGVLHRAFLTVNSGTAMEYVRSTAEGSVSKEEYTEYIRMCVQRLAEHGIDCGERPK